MSDESHSSPARYQQAVAELENRARQAEASGDLSFATELQSRAEAVRAWISAGAPGTPPVDLEAYGVTLPAGPTLDAGLAVPERPMDPRSDHEPGERSSSDSPETPGDSPDPGEVARQASELRETPPSGNGRHSPYDEAEEDELEQLLGRLENPEQVNLRRQIAEARDHYSKDRWREVIGLVTHVLSHYSAMDREQQLNLQQLRAQAQEQLNARLTGLLAQAAQARANDELATAQSLYRQAQELDADNSDVKRGMLELDQIATSEQSATSRRAMQRRLSERLDVAALGEAVREAEALDAEGRLTDELATALNEARLAWDGLRKTQSEVTTQMRLGDLKLIKEARDRIEDQVEARVRTIFDSTLGQNRPAAEVLDEANRRYREASEDTAQYEVNRVRAGLPKYPVWAHERLRLALEHPFFEKDRQKLEALHLEIDQLIERQQEAQELLNRAEAVTDPVETLDLLLQAHERFVHQPGLADRVARARRTAAAALAARMAELHHQAQTDIATEHFEAALGHVSEAAQVAARWPEEEQPAELMDRLAIGEQFVDRVEQERQRRAEFERYAKQIRDYITDEATRQSAFDLFQRVSADDRLKSLPEYIFLLTELDKVKGIGEQLSDAQAARAAADWMRVRHLAESMKKSGKAGQLRQQVDDLHEEAIMELAIARAQELLGEDRLADAEKIINHQLASRRFGGALKGRLAGEIDRIEQGRQGTLEIQPLFDQARGLAASGDSREMLRALRLFRFVGGDASEPPQAGWPTYTLSFLTAEARKQADQLRSALRERLLDPILSRYRQRTEGQQALDDMTMRHLADDARALREARLLDSEPEREAVRYFEVVQGKIEARAREQAGDWGGAREIWRRLSASYPLLVEEDLRRARIQHAIMQSDQLAQQGNTLEAIELLRGLETSADGDNEPAVGPTWQVSLQMAEIYLLREEFEPAERNIERAVRLAPSQPEVDDLRRKARRQKAARRALNEAERVYQRLGPMEALRLLREALKQESTLDDPLLRERQSQIFRESAETLLGRAQERRLSGQAEGKVEAVTALVDLRELEQLAELPAEQQRAESELQPLRADLVQVAQSMIRRVRQFDPFALSLEQALAEASASAGRLQAFGEVTPLFEELNDHREVLENSRARVAADYEKLKQLEKLLAAANSADAWREALLSDNFGTLEQMRVQVQSLQLGQMLEVRRLEEHLVEWREIHGYLRRQIVTIKRQFLEDENFSEARLALRRLHARPDSRPESELPWRQLTQHAYDEIRQLIASKLRVQDLWGDQDAVIVGWANVEQQAAERQEELQQWQEWDIRCEQTMEIARQHLELSLQATTSVTLVGRISSWQAATQTARLALEELTRGPINDDRPVPVRSKKAEALRVEGQRRAQFGRQWLAEANQRLAELESELAASPFPTARELSEASTHKNWARLESLIQRGEHVGASTSEEERRLDHYRRILAKHKGNSNQRSWRDRLRGR